MQYPLQLRPFLDFRLALFFQAFCFFVLYLLCLLLGASLAMRAQRPTGQASY
jgi:hypothetical protein